MTTATDKLLTAKETAELLGVRVQTLAAWRLEARELPYTRVGRSIRYRLSAVQEYLDKQTVPASA